MNDNTLNTTEGSGDAPATALARIRFVLVETSLSGNIGAVARAMKTMGLTQMALVRPRQLPNAEAIARAAGADDLLAQAAIHPTLPAALTGCRFIMGASARMRSLAWPVMTAAAAAQQLIAEAQHGEVALVLGRENSGLTNDELAQCHYLAHIDTNPEFSSLNVGAAAQVFAYEIRQAWLARQLLAPAVSNEINHDAATAEELEGLFTHLEETLDVLQFAPRGRSAKLHRRLRRLFQRARPDRTEINIMRGILRAATMKRFTDD